MRSNSDLMALALETHIITKCHGWEKQVRTDALEKQVSAIDPGDLEAVRYAVINIFRRRDSWQSPEEYDDFERIESMRDYMDELFSDDTNKLH